MEPNPQLLDFPGPAGHAHGTEPLPPDHPCYPCDARRISIANGLQCSAMSALRALGSTFKLDPGETLFHEGDLTDRVYALAQGSLRLYQLLPDGRRYVNGFLLPGDFLGISAEPQHAVTAQALQETRLWSFSRSTFDQFVERHPPLRKSLYRMALQDLATAQKHMTLLGRKTALERVATFLHELLERFERIAGARLKAMTLPMSRSDIADDLGLTKETISRLFSALKRERVIKLDGLDHVTVLDRQRLVAFGDGKEIL